MEKALVIVSKALLGIGTVVLILMMSGLGEGILERLFPSKDNNLPRQLSEGYVALSREGLWTEANKYRERPLPLDPVLNQTAQAKCEKIARTGEPVHGDLAAELAHLDRRVYGENLAEGYESPNQIVTAWANSPTHNNNMRDPDWGRVGYGICNSTPLGVIVVQQFSD